MLSQVLSFAGSSRHYWEDNGCPGFRARKTEVDTVRVHVAKSKVRYRDNYVAMDIPFASFSSVANAVIGKPAKAIAKKVKKTKKVAVKKTKKAVVPKKKAKKGKK